MDLRRGGWLMAVCGMARRGIARRGNALCAVTAASIAASSVAASSIASASIAAPAADILADPPSDLSVTVYRAPYRHSGSINLDYLEGFALVTETRTVQLPAGLTRLRFEGVADGIEPVSAIVTGLPSGVIEKNRDARLLSPEALIAAAVGKPVELLRTNRRAGTTVHVPGTILSDAHGGVVFQTADGIEALRCSGLPETFDFTPSGGLSARPTLSVTVRSARAVARQVTLSYLARGFDWAADYSATLSDDGKSLDLGAWVTLANSNGVGFPSARTQVVAGRLNRENGEVEPIDAAGPILANCWPRGSTSDLPTPLVFRKERGLELDLAAPMAARAAGLPESAAVTVTAQRVTQEQLGDLKLYRVPERTTVAARQSKQVRLMDRFDVPVATVYRADLAPEASQAWTPARRLIRTMNTAQNHLGLPLPSGSIGLFGDHGREKLLEHESGLRDTAVGEQLEIDAGASPEVQWSSTAPARSTVPAPGAVPARSAGPQDERVEISNSRPAAVTFELRLHLPDGSRVIRADHPLEQKNGRPIFTLTVPANGTETVNYQWQRAGVIPVR